MRRLFMFRSPRRSILGLSALFGISLVHSASAAGLYVSDSGVRANGRGTAFVAGADDALAMAYNPAGIVFAGNSILADFTYVSYSTTFTRQTQVLDAQGGPHVYSFPTVNGKAPFLPIPFIGATFALDAAKRWSAGLSIQAPQAGLLSYPDKVDNGPAPQRYSLINLDGSALVALGGTIATKPLPWLAVGLGLEMLVGKFASQVTFSANPNDRFIGAPEDPKYDAQSQLTAGPILSPSANAGVVLLPTPWLRFGAAFVLPFVINSGATIQVRLPEAALFNNARQDGDAARVVFTLPAKLNLGVEVRPIPALRLEVSFSRQFWSAHETIDIRPRNVALLGVTGFPEPFYVGNISLQRRFTDANSFRLGGEYNVRINETSSVDLRLGVRYDQSAVPIAYLTPLTVDLDHVTASIGAGYKFHPRWRIDAQFSKLFTSETFVDPAIAKVSRVNPVQGNPTATDAVNGGTYSVDSFTLGVGVNYAWDTAGEVAAASKPDEEKSDPSTSDNEQVSPSKAPAVREKPRY